MTYTTPPSPTVPASQPEKSGLDIKRIILFTAGGLVGVIVVLFIISLVIAKSNNESLGSIIQAVRDLVIIFLALEGILIIVALAVLILQVARLINLLQNEVRPVLKDTQETLRSARGTVEFVGDTVSGPVIKASAFMTGVGAFVRNVGGIRRAMEHTIEESTNGKR
jgi:hypothetical protein